MTKNTRDPKDYPFMIVDSESKVIAWSRTKRIANNVIKELSGTNNYLNYQIKENKGE